MRWIFTTLFILLSWTSLNAKPLGVLPDVRLSRGGAVWSIAVEDNGKIILGGNFSSINGVERQNLARLHPDGSVDLEWDPGADGTVYALALSGDYLFAGGLFNYIGNKPRSYLAKIRLKGKGEADPEWDADLSGGEVRALAVHDNHLYAGGYFNRSGETIRNKLAKFNAGGRGTLDKDWNPDPSGPVNALIANNDFLYVGGWFTRIGMENRNYLARIQHEGNGDVDPDWNPSPDDAVYALALDETHLYAGGTFQTISEIERPYLAKIETQQFGKADFHWNPSPNDGVHALVVKDADLYAGGWFTRIGGQDQSYIAKIGTVGNGELREGWNARLDGGVLALAITDLALYAGGSFEYAGSSLSAGAVALDPIVGKKNLAFETNVLRPGIVYALVRQPDGKTIVGGNFLLAGSIRRNNIARIQEDGTLDADWDPQCSGEVFALAVDDQFVYAGGAFHHIGGQNRMALARLHLESGLADADWKANANDSIYSLALADGNLYVGGWFTQIGETEIPFLAKVNQTTGEVDESWQPTPNHAVTEILIDGGMLYIGGSFTMLGESPHKYLAKINSNGKPDEHWKPNPNNAVVALASDQKHLFAGGLFDRIGGQSKNYLAKLDKFKGDVDTYWNPNPNDRVWSLALANDQLYIGGHFTQIGGRSRNHIARIEKNQTGKADAEWNPNASGKVWSIAVDGEDISFGGEFKRVAGRHQSGVALLHPSAYSPPILFTQNLRTIAERPFSYVLKAKGNPTAFSAENLPEGLSLNPETGVISGTPLQPGTTTFTATVSNHWGSNSGQFTITILSELEIWRKFYFGITESDGVAANNADPDDDGIPNLLEYAFNLHPRTPQRIHLPRVYKVRDPHDGNIYLQFTYRQRTGGRGQLGYNYTTGGIIYRVEVIGNETDNVWKSDPELVIQANEIVDNGDGTETVTVRAAHPIEPGENKRVRLHVLPVASDKN